MKKLSPAEKNLVHSLSGQIVSFEHNGKSYSMKIGELKGWQSTHGIQTSVGMSTSFVLTKVGREHVVVINTQGGYFAGTPADFMATADVLKTGELVENPLPSSGGH